MLELYVRQKTFIRLNVTLYIVETYISKGADVEVTNTDFKKKCKI